MVCVPTKGHPVRVSIPFFVFIFRAIRGVPLPSVDVSTVLVGLFSLGSTPQRPPGVTSGILPGSRPSRLPKSPFALGFSCVRFSVLIFGSLKIVTAVLSDVVV